MYYYYKLIPRYFRNTSISELQELQNLELGTPRTLNIFIHSEQWMSI